MRFEKNVLIFIPHSALRVFRGALNIEENDTERLLDECGDADLGHISSGLDASNNPFFTVYFDDYGPMIKKLRKEKAT